MIGSPTARERACRGARALVVALAWACGDEPGDAGDDDGGSTGEPEPPPMPDFAEPASGRLDVPVARVGDVALSVLGVVPGHTRLWIDGAVRGALDARDPTGTLSPDTLVLRLRGAMVPGVHTLQLANSGEEAPLLSRPLEVHLVPEPEPPVLVAEQTGEPVVGSAVLTAGAGDRSVLAILDDTRPGAPVLVVAPLREDGWDLESARRVAIPGYRRDAGELGPAIAVDADPDRLRVAWRVGLPGTAIDLVETSWDTEVDAAPVRAFDLDPGVLGPYEHAELGRPALLGDTIVAEVLAATDIEAPRPGDRALVHARLSGMPAGVGPAARLVLEHRRDLDAIGPALDPAALEVAGAPILSARIDLRTPVVVRVDPVHGRPSVSPTTDTDPTRGLGNVVGSVATVRGAFGSRRVAGLLPGDPPRVRLMEIDDFTGGVREHSLPLDADTDPEPASVTGELAVGLVAGVAVWLVPRSADAPVIAIVTGAMEPVAAPLEGLACEAVATAFDPGDLAAPLHVACASGGGTITRARLSLRTD